MKPWPLIAMENALFADASLGWPERCAHVAEAGFDGIYAVAHPLNEDQFARIPSLASEPARHGLRLAGVYVNVDLAQPAGSPANTELVQFCQKLEGIPRLEISFKCSDPAKSPNFIDDAVAARLKPVLRIAEQNQYKVALYPHSFYPLETITHARHLVKKIGHERLGFVFPSSHVFATHSTEETLRQLRDCAGQIASFNLCGCKRLSPQLPSKCQHLPLGEGQLDHLALLSVLAAGRYRGDVILQGHGWQGDLSGLLQRSVSQYRQFFSASLAEPKSDDPVNTQAPAKQTICKS